MMRISMSIPIKLLKDFDEVLKYRGYDSRSKGIRDALKDYVIRHQWLGETEGERIGIISIIYDRYYTDINGRLVEVLHNYKDKIKTSMHIPLNSKYHMEVIIVNGDINTIRDLTEKVMGLTGVQNVKLSITAIEKVFD